MDNTSVCRQRSEAEAPRRRSHGLAVPPHQGAPTVSLQRQHRPHFAAGRYWLNSHKGTKTLTGSPQRSGIDENLEPAVSHALEVKG
jgi:hypothetical protein